MNVRKGAFRLWVVASVLFVVGVGAASYATIHDEFHNAYALPPATFCLGCFAEAELEREAHAREIAASGITDEDIPF